MARSLKQLVVRLRDWLKRGAPLMNRTDAEHTEPVPIVDMTGWSEDEKEAWRAGARKWFEERMRKARLRSGRRRAP